MYISVINFDQLGLYVEELTEAMRQLEVAHRQEKAAERMKVVAESEQQTQQLAIEEQCIQDLNIELEGELAQGYDEMKDLEERLKQLKSAKEDLEEEDTRIDEVLKERKFELKKVDEQFAEQEREIRRRKEEVKEAGETLNKQLAQERYEAFSSLRATMAKNLFLLNTKLNTKAYKELSPRTQMG